jgi:hypothetical protein
MWWAVDGSSCLWRATTANLKMALPAAEMILHGGPVIDFTFACKMAVWCECHDIPGSLLLVP